LLLLPVLRLDRSDNDRKFVAFGRKKILVLVKLTALMIYAKAGLLRPRPRPRTLPQGQGQGLAVAKPRPRPQILALRPRPRTNITETSSS